MSNTDPIHAEMQGNKQNQADWLGLERTAPAFDEASGDVSSFHSVAACTGPNGARGDLEPAAASARKGKSVVAGDMCVDKSPGAMDQWDISFGDLLALAEGSSTVPWNHISTSHGASSSSVMLHGAHNIAPGSNSQFYGHCTAENNGLSVPRQFTYDLNFPPGIVGNAVSRTAVPQFAPMTPNKAGRAENNHVSEAQSLHAYYKGNHEENEDEVDASQLQGLLQPETDSSVIEVSTVATDNHNSEEGGSQVIELNKTPQQKPKRRKHRPKVVREDKPKQSPKPTVTPNSTGSNENPTGKRKYVRKANKPTTTPAEVNTSSADPKILEPQPTKDSCRRALKFGTQEQQAQQQDQSSTQRPISDLDSESRVQDFCTEVQSKSSTQVSQGSESRVENTQAGLAYDLTRSEVLKECMSLLDTQAPSTSSQMKTNVSREFPDQGKGDQVNVHGKQKDNAQTMMKNTQSVARSPNDSTCCTIAVLTDELQARTSKRKCSNVIEEASNTNRNGVQFNSLQFYASLLHFPNIYKKSRSEKGPNSVTTSTSPSLTEMENAMPPTCRHDDVKTYPHVSKDNNWNSAFQLNTSRVPGKLESGRSLQARDQTLDYLLPFTQQERLIKRRSEAVPRVRHLASLDKLSECQMQPTYSAKQGSVDGDTQGVKCSGQPSVHTESLIADSLPTPANRKQSKARNYISGLTSYYTNKAPLRQQIVLYKHHQSSAKSAGGPPKLITWQDLIDSVTEQFKYLDINRESDMIVYQESKTLVPYNQDHNALVLYRTNASIVPFQGAFSPVRPRRPRPKVELDDETNKVWRLLLENINNEGIDGTDEEKRRWWEEERRVFRGRADSFIARMHLVQGDRRFSRWKGSVVDSVVGVFLTQNVSDHLSSSAFMSLAARYPLKSESYHNPLEEEEVTLLVKEPEMCLLDSYSGTNSEAEELKNKFEPTFTQLLEMARSNMLHEVSSHRSLNVQCRENSKDAHSTSEKSTLTAESGIQGTVQDHVIVLESSTSCSVNNQPSNLQGDENVTIQSQDWSIGDSNAETLAQEQNKMQQTLNFPNLSGETLDVTESTNTASDNQRNIEQKAVENKALKEINAAKQKSRRVGREIKNDVDWDTLRKEAEANGKKREKTTSTMDSLDWEAIRCADVNDIAETIKERGMNNMLAERIKAFLNRLVKDHGSIDLEWLRDVSPDEAKEYLLSIRGLGLKSVECVRLLTLHHLAFPVDTNVGRIAVRLGWVPLQPLPESLQLHLLELYPVLESIQKYLWPRLCKLEQKQLYELHYQMITFGKVFCTKSKPNCNACPMRGECRHFASAFASARLALPAPEEKSIVPATEKTANPDNAEHINGLPLPPPQTIQQLEGSMQLGASLRVDNKSLVTSCEPIIEEPASPEPENTQDQEHDIEEAFYDDPDEIPTIKLNIEEFTQNLQNYMEKNMELRAGEMSKALVALTSEAASLPIPKLKNMSRLRTEHQVYELPDSHPLLEGRDKREPDDPCSYLLAIWTPGETANSIQQPEGGCSYQESGKLCDQKTCFACNSIREANSQMVRGTLLIPCRTAMRGSFPLNGTYFQVNEVFADHDSSLNPIDVPRSWIWNLPRRTVYFGTSVPSIFKGLPTEGIQHCFWRGYVCVRGFDQKTRAPRPLMARLHFPASKLTKSKGKTVDE